jgi:hypothetical protein
MWITRKKNPRIPNDQPDSLYIITHFHSAKDQYLSIWAMLKHLYGSSAFKMGKAMDCILTFKGSKSFQINGIHTGTLWSSLIPRSTPTFIPLEHSLQKKVKEGPEEVKTGFSAFLTSPVDWDLEEVFTESVLMDVPSYCQVTLFRSSEPCMSR